MLRSTHDKHSLNPQEGTIFLKENENFWRTFHITHCLIKFSQEPAQHCADL